MAESASAPPTPREPALVAWGARVGREAVSGAFGLPLVVALRGRLGAGKSVLARAMARGAGVTSPMPSPTYNLLFAYEGSGGVQVLHLDLYRLDDPDDVWELGWQELGEGDQLVLIEWPERAESLLPPDRWDVSLEFTEEDGMRAVTVARRGRAPAPPAIEPADRPGDGEGEGT